MKKLFIFLLFLAVSCGKDEVLKEEIDLEKSIAPPACLYDYQNLITVNPLQFTRHANGYDYLKDNSFYFMIVDPPFLNDHVNEFIVLKLLIQPGISYVKINGVKYYSPSQPDPLCGQLCPGIIYAKVYWQGSAIGDPFVITFETGNVSGSGSIGIGVWLFVADECDEIDILHNVNEFYENQFIQVEE